MMPTPDARHRSVLLEAAVEALVQWNGGTYADLTCGLGGHTGGLLEADPEGRVLALDRDPRALAIARKRLADHASRVVFVEASFSELQTHGRRHGLWPFDGVLADLGVSSLQFDDPGRGFSFRQAGPLDMRMGPSVGANVAEHLADIDESGLARVLARFGEVPRARSVARAILKARDEGGLKSTLDLARAIEAGGGGRRGSAVHPATLAFQGLRIWVNRELEELDALLDVLPEALRPGGRAALISFHSLEDRRVKRAFAGPKLDPALRHLPHAPELGPWRALSSQAPNEEEKARNPRARSARLRVAERRPS